MFKLLLLIPLLMALAFLTVAVFGSFWIVFKVCSGIVRALSPVKREPIKRRVREVRHVHVIEDIAPRPRAQRVREAPAPSAVPTILGIMVVALAVFGFTSHRHGGQIHSSAFGQNAATARPAGVKDISWTAVGVGATRGEAIRKALDELKHDVSDHIHETLPQLEWTPSTEYLQRHLVRKIEEKDVEVTDKNDPFTGARGEHLGWVKEAKVTVSIAPANHEDFIRQDKQFRATTRLFLLAKVLAGLFLVFGVIGLYVRLDDYSKGYYRVWLGLGAVAIMLGAGVVAVLFFA